MKYLSWGMTALFVLWAYYQWNDPDALGWMVIYLIAAAGSALNAKGKLSWQMAAGAAIILVAWAFELGLQFEWAHPLLQIEEWREMMGLLVIALWASVIVIMQRKQANKV